MKSVGIFDAEDPTCVNVPDEIDNALNHIVANYVNNLIKEYIHHIQTMYCLQ